MAKENNYKSPINWYGGKSTLRKQILALVPEHTAFVEGFGGAGHIIFSKPASAVEVYNDINSNLVNLFRVLRDKKKAEEFSRLLTLTPYSREEHSTCKQAYAGEIVDDIERARIFYVGLMQSFGSSLFGTWSFTKICSRRGMSKSTSQWLSGIDDKLPAAIERIREIQIEHLDFTALLPKYDAPETFWFFDPPYPHATRVAKSAYEHEMSDFQHERLVDMLLQLQGKVMLSGYANPIYQRLVDNGWKLIDIGLINSGMPREGKVEKRELVWLNYDPSTIKPAFPNIA